MFKDTQIYIRTGAKVSKVYTIGNIQKIIFLLFVLWTMFVTVIYFGLWSVENYIGKLDGETYALYDQVELIETRIEQTSNLQKETEATLKITDEVFCGSIFEKWRLKVAECDKQ